MMLASQTSRRRGYILALEAEYGEEFGMEDPGDTSVAGCVPASCVSSLVGTALVLNPIKMYEYSFFSRQVEPLPPHFFRWGS